MANGTLIDAFLVELGLDPTKFNKGQKEALENFKKTQDQARKLAGEIEEQAKKIRDVITNVRNQALGLFALFTAGKGIRDFISSTSNLENWVGRLSKTMNMSAGTLNAWQNMAKQVGGSAEGISGSMQGVTQAIQEFAVTGNSTIIPYLRSLGINLQDANGKIKTADQLFLEFSDKLQGVDKPRASFILQQMGLDQGTIFLLAEGRKKLEAMLEEQKKLGVVTDADVESGKQFVSVWSKIEQVSSSVGRGILTDLTPALSWLLEKLQALGEWFRVHPNVARAAFAALAVAVGVLTAAIGIGLVGAVIALAGVSAPVLGVVAAIAAAAAAIVYLYNKFEIFRKAWTTFWTGGTMALAAKIADWIVGRLNKAKEGTSVTIPLAPPPSKSLGGPYALPGTPKADDSDVGKLMKMGWTRDQAIGIATNIQRESGGKPGAVGDSGEAYGLAQWHPDRQRDFLNRFGHDIRKSTRDEQLAFIDYELRRGKEVAAGRELAAARDARTAAAIVSKLYERPKLASEANIRADIASRIAAGLGGGGGGTSNTVSNQTSIGTINVHTQATDADAIARDIKPAIERNNFSAQSNYGPN